MMFSLNLISITKLNRSLFKTLIHNFVELKSNLLHWCGRIEKFFGNMNLT